MQQMLAQPGGIQPAKICPQWPNCQPCADYDASLRATSLSRTLPETQPSGVSVWRAS
jgi:hypothetical protein